MNSEPKRRAFVTLNSNLSLLTLCLGSTLLIPQSAFAWGERGHDLITRVAVRTLHQRLGEGNKLTPALLIKEHQLCHLANSPDIVWRNMDENVRNLNSPTHFIDLEFLTTKPLLASLPRTIAEAAKMISDQCSAPNNSENCAPNFNKESPNITAAVFDKVGTAPWRVEQLALGLEDQWARLKKLQDGKADAKLQQAAYDEAIKYAGLLSHFVGDLAQPLHTTKNYDGWESNQGGVHAYFETDVVNEFPLAFDQEVFDITVKQKPFDRIMKGAGKNSEGALTRAWALTIDSRNQLSLVLDLDKRSMIAKSQQTKEGLKIPAKRKSPSSSTKVFQSTIANRMAVGADVLANIWLTAWQNAGKPDLSTITSYTYFYSPEFIPAGYMTN